MRRGLFAGLCAVALGCGATGRQHYTPPPEQIPPAVDVGGALVVIDDQRPDWERQPFTGPISLFHLGRVRPNPWAILAKETEAVVAAMPEKPAKVNVTVVSYRLVKRDEGAVQAQTDAARQARVPDDPTSKTPSDVSRWNYDAARNAQQAGDQKTANAAVGALVANPVRQAVAPLTFGSAWSRYPADLADHPSGASCALTAVVQLIDANGQARHVRVQCFGAGENTSGTAYWGEALEYAARLAVAQFGRQFREGVGLPQQ